MRGQWYKGEQEPKTQPFNCGTSWTGVEEWRSGQGYRLLRHLQAPCATVFRIWVLVMVRRPLIGGMTHTLDLIHQMIWILYRNFLGHYFLELSETVFVSI